MKARKRWVDSKRVNLIAKERLSDRKWRLSDSKRKITAQEIEYESKKEIIW